jgi:pyruvate formate lyase activating enzyme
VFLQGCPLRCAWCSTPESQFARPGVGRDPAALYGESMTVAEVVAEITRDEVFYYHSGGGATISGGEPLAQGEFTAAILKAVKAHGIATAVETTLFAAPKYVFAALEWTDHLLVDIKHTDSAAHARWTGVPVEPIIRNLRAVGASGFPGRITVRLPYIPGINSERANLVATGRIAAGLPGPAELELVPYHRLGVGTYEALDWDYALPDLRPPARADLMAAVAYLADSIPGLTVALAR